MKSKYLTKLLIAVQIISLLSLKVDNTYAIGFSDIENSTDNTLSTTTLDLGIRSGQGNFVSGADQMERGDSVARDIYVQNLGDLSFAYRSSYEFKSGDEPLCDILELKVWYNWYDAAPPSPGDHSTRHMDLVYSGSLQDFENITNEDMLIPNDHTYYDNIFYSENEHWFYYRISIPEDASYEASQKTCTFDIKTVAWQEEFADETLGFWDEETIESTISTADWAPYVKIEDPEDGDVVQGTVHIYGTVADINPHHYWLVIQNSSGTTVAGPGVVNESSSFTNDNLYTWDTTAVPNGTYTIKLEARDAAGNKDPNLAPVPSDLEDPIDSIDWIDVEVENGDSADEGDVVINELMWMGSTTSDNDEWIELYNDTDDPINLKNWVLGGAGDGADLVFPDGAEIPAHGYFLISNFDSNDSNSALNVAVDWVTEDIDLDNDGEQLILIDALDNEIDRTPENVWEDGLDDTQKKSMERNDTPGDGDSWDDWHTCIDPICNSDTYWDTDGGDNYGTPGSENHSENDPSNEPDQDEIVVKLEIIPEDPSQNVIEEVIEPEKEEPPTENPPDEELVEDIEEVMESSESAEV